MANPPLLIDLGDLCECHTDIALEEFYKATSQPPDDDDSFSEHENAFIRRLVDLFTQRGFRRIATFFKELNTWVSRTHAGAAASAAVGKAKGGPRPDPLKMMRRWTAPELGQVHSYLWNIEPAAMTASDWSLVVDYLVQRYLPADDMRSEAEWLAVRSTLMGRVQANLGRIKAEQADVVLAALPVTVDGAGEAFSLTPEQRGLLQYAGERCADHITNMTEALRARVKSIVIRHQESALLGNPSRHALETELFDAMGTMNRDWRRVAVTEAGENCNQGVVASVPAGAKLRRMEMYRGACSFCRGLDGRVFNVVSPGDPAKDGQRDVWVGKTNVGRAASPRKRVGDKLVERPAEERWWPAAGVQHPHCRGRWLPEYAPKKSDDPEFSAWLDKLLKKK